MRVGVLIGIALLASACTQAVTGSPGIGVNPPAPGSLFDGDLPAYGQTWSADDNAKRAYVRALRRIDPCGLAEKLQAPGSLDQITGDIGSCNARWKIPGQKNHLFVSVRPDLEDVSHDVVAFRVGDTPVYSFEEGGCSFSVPIAIDKLSGAPAPPKRLKPVLAVLVTDPEGAKCAMAQDILKSAVAVSPTEYPVRSAVSAYPIPLAERDPCEILGDYPGLLARSDLGGFGGPFVCTFMLRDSPLSYRLGFTAHTDGIPDGYTAESSDGVDFYYRAQERGDGTACGGIAMFGKMPGTKDVGSGTYGRRSFNEQRMSIDVDATARDGKGCDPVYGMLRKAAALFKNSAG